MSVATVVAPARANAETMSTRCPAQVKRTAVTPRRLALPAARLALVRAAEECERRAQEDQHVRERRAVLDVPDVVLDPLLPGERGATVDLRPAGDPRRHVEPLALALVVALDLVAERRPRPNHAHVA